jgi:hypothetical protein
MILAAASAACVNLSLHLAPARAEEQLDAVAQRILVVAYILD